MGIKPVGWKLTVFKVWRLVATGEACRWVTVDWLTAERPIHICLWLY